MVEEQYCYNCKYYRDIVDYGRSECHRHPPIHIGADVFRFPNVEPSEWCGEWEKNGKY